MIFPSGNHFDHFRESSGNSFPKKIWNIVERRSCKSVWWFVDGRSFVINKRWIKENGEILDGNNKWMNIRKVFNSTSTRRRIGLRLKTDKVIILVWFVN